MPEAASKIVSDRLHVMGYLGKAVDTVRKQEHRESQAKGDGTLTGNKYLWPSRQSMCPRRDARNSTPYDESDGPGPSRRRSAICGCTSTSVSLEVLETLAFQSHAESVGTPAQGGQDGSSAYREHPDLVPASGDQRNE